MSASGAGLWIGPVHETHSVSEANCPPEYPVEGVTFTNGVTQSEAELVAASYLRRVVGGCGMPDRALDEGDFWHPQLWGGITGSDSGQLQVAKDGTKSLLQPPPKGLRSSTKELPEPQGLAYESIVL